MTTLGSTPVTIGYCTNVHAGTDLESIRRNLEQHAVAARIASQSDPLGVGLWLPATAAAEVAGCVAEFRSFLGQHRLHPFTFNGFPYDNFHEPVVKRRVYSPTWWQPQRLEYTQQLADILSGLLADSDSTGSISTLPIGWSEPSATSQQLAEAGANLRTLADYLAGIESQSGKRIVVAIEPEPGCLLDTTADVIAWFDEHLSESRHRRYITVCHDVCHSAVMMESQADVMARLATAGIGIGKVQVSSAIVADWQSMAIGRRREAIEQLSQFAEDRYLHQTGRRTPDQSFVLAEDLPRLLEGIPEEDDPVRGDEKWVVHFHVPVFLERFGHLSTSHLEIESCLRALDSTDGSPEFTGHLEVETYAWTVLPESMRKRALAEDIASEIIWLRDVLDGIT